MNLLLDTTIQIDRFLSSKERKEAINDVLKDNTLYSSTYVLGEYYNLINDFLTLYSLFIRDKDIAETGRHITEKTFGRSQSRVQKLYSNIIGWCEYDVNLIIDSLDNFLVQIVNVFTYKLEMPLINCTYCARAKQEINYDEEVPMLKKVRCRKNTDVCKICNFWNIRKEELDNLLTVNTNQKFMDILHMGKNKIEEFKGDNCKAIGDVIICLETKELENDTAVCSSNKKDFKPICDCLKIELKSPNYREKEK